MGYTADLPSTINVAKLNASAQDQLMVEQLITELDTNGIVALPNLVSSDRLHGMQKVFALRLRRLRWNNFDGYHKTEPYRHMVEDVLLLDQGFVDIALHPLVRQILNRYVGRYELTEAKGWKSN